MCVCVWGGVFFFLLGRGGGGGEGCFCAQHIACRFVLRLLAADDRACTCIPATQTIEELPSRSQFSVISVITKKDSGMGEGGRGGRGGRGEWGENESNSTRSWSGPVFVMP